MSNDTVPFWSSVREKSLETLLPAQTRFGKLSFSSPG